MKSAFLSILFFFSPLALAAPQPLLPPAPNLFAKGYALLAYNSGQIIAQERADQRIEPASLTKLMTAYLSFTALKQGRITLQQTLPVSEHAWRAEGSRMFIQPNKPVTVDELLHGMIVQSGNDAAIALAEGIAGSEDAFVALMNREAQRLGMVNTHFMNATGLPHPQHYSTPHDLALLARAIIRDFPEFYPLYSIKEYRYNNISQANRNRLLWQDPYVDGMKTGHTEAAGYCLVSSAKRGQTRFISVVVGADSDHLRASESQKLLNYGFQFFETYRPYAKNQVIASLPVWKGSEHVLKAGLADDLFVTVPRGQYGQIAATLVSRQPLLAPLSIGQTVGTLRISLAGKIIAEHDLVALDNVSVANMFGRAWDNLRLMVGK
ncbi:MAG: D-alanyl-D-alanine carboxypeptidase family protein [Burkholderiales bacterium]